MKKAVLSILSLFLAWALSAQSTVIFEEQFDGGIPDTWEISSGDPEGAVWQWSSTGEAEEALVDGVVLPAIFWGTLPAIQSPSVANGAAMYNSDVYDAGGSNVGAGPYPGTHSGSLTSPVIDCSGEEQVYLSFYQFARANANSISTIVEASNDGETWVEFPINRTVTENGSTAANNLQVIDISEVAAGQATVQVRFTWDGRYYFWLIDDVQLITPPEYEWELDSFFYTPSSFIQPVTQIGTDTFAFIIEASNLGTEPIPNFTFKATVQQIVGNNTTTIYTDSLLIDTFASQIRDSILRIEEVFAPELGVGDYQIRYELYSQDDIAEYTRFNNVQTAPFRVSNALFAKEDDIDVAFRPSAGGDYAIGNFYQMSPLSGNNYVIQDLRFASAKNASDGPLEGNIVTFLIYRVKDEVEPNWSNFDDATDESLDIAGFGTYEFTAADENFDLITVEVFNLDGEPIELDPGARYFVMASYADENSVLFHTFNDDIDYWTSDLFKVSTVLFRETWFLAGFGRETAAVLRMAIELATATDETPLEDNAMTLFPNPSSEVLNVQLGLEEATPAMLIIADMQGKVLDIREYDNVQKETLQFNVSHLPAGTYLMRVSTDAGTKTKQFVVAK